MRADIIIILPPFLDDVPSVSEAPEDFLVQALVPDPESLGAGAFTSAVKISEGRPTTPWIRERLRELG